jgi:catechol 2,3-dioxygenase-like lactoylglutathione lyase family enzyme
MLPEQISAAITFLKTSDLEETTHFYRNILKLPLVLDQGPCRIFRILPGAYVGFCIQDTAPDNRDVILTLVLEDVDSVCTALEGAGVPIEVQPRYNEQYQIYQCFARDPNGYLIEIQRFHDPGWKEDLR